MMMIRRMHLLLVCLLAWAAVTMTASSLPARAEPVTFEFEQASLKAVFQSLADAAALNVLLDESVQGEVTFSLRGVPAMEAIELIALMSGLRHRVIGNTLLIATPERMRSDFLAADQRLFELRQAHPVRAQELLEQLYPNISILADPDTHVLIVRGEGAELDAAIAFLEQYDRRGDRELRFVHAPVDQVLWALADRAGWNLVVEGRLEATVTASLEGIEFREALRLVSEATNLHYKLSDRVLYVREVPEEPGSPDRVAMFRLDYVDPETSRDLLGMVVPDVQANVDVASRTLVLSGNDAQLQAAAEFLRAFDVPQRQVLVEARVEEISLDDLQRIGVDWSLPTLQGGSILAWNPADLRAVLDILAEHNRSKTLASPKIAAIDGEAARIFIGDRIPQRIQTTDSEGRISEEIEFIEVGITLEVTPRIGQDDFVTLDILTEISSIGAMTPDHIPEMRTREAQTRVRVQDGQPLVIGGLIQEVERATMRRLPLLGDLPLVGQLFRTQIHQDVQSETVIFLIPHIVDGAESVASGSGAGARLSEDRLKEIESVFNERSPDTSNQAMSLELFHLLSGTADLEWEGRAGNQNLLTRLYASDTQQGLTWGMGFGIRRYMDTQSRLWVDLTAERLQPAGEREPAYLLSARTGGQAHMGDASRLFLEPYAVYTHRFGTGLPDEGLVPGRSA